MKQPKRKPAPVVMPLRLTDKMVREIAGNPLILVASDAVIIKWWYQRIRQSLIAARKGAK